MVELAILVAGAVSLVVVQVTMGPVSGYRPHDASMTMAWVCITIAVMLGGLEKLPDVLDWIALKRQRRSKRD